MKFCQQHWDALRAAIDERGLSDLIAPDGETAMAQMADQLKRASDGERPDTPVNYDPLIAAHNAITGNVMALSSGVALELLSPRSDGGDWCPLCFANEKNPYGHNYDIWIQRAADDQARHVAEMRGKDPR